MRDSNTTVNYLASIIVLVLVSQNAIGQGKWNWPKDSANARREVTFYSDLLHSGEFEKAKPHLDWLLEHAPNLNPSIYINGVKIYDELAKRTTDPNIKNEYLKTQLSLYDNRIKHFGVTKNLSKRRLMAAYKIYRGNPAQYEELQTNLDELLESYEFDIPENLILVSSDLLKRRAKAGQVTSPEMILERYDFILEKFDSNNLQSDKTYAILKKQLATIIDFDCEVLEQWLGSKIDLIKNDTTWLKRAVSYAIKQECTAAPFFVASAEIMMERSPTFGLAKLLAIKYEKQNEPERAEGFYQQAISLAHSEDKLYQSHMNLAKFYKRKSKWSKAKSSAIAASKIFPDKIEHHEFIGDLYLDGAESCKKKISRVKDRAIYIAAKNHYLLANNKVKINIAKQQFPSINQIFDEGFQEGESLQINCWVNERVKIERRKSIQN